MNQPIEQTGLRTAFEAVWQSKDQIATELEKMVDQYPSETGRRLKRLVDSFRGNLDYEDVLMNPEILTIILPLLTQPEAFQVTSTTGSVQSAEQISNQEQNRTVETANTLDRTDDLNRQIARAVREGCNRIALLPPPASLRVFGILSYPLLLAFVVWIVWIITGRTLVRQLREAVEEFGMEVSGLANAIFYSAGLISDYWYFVLPLPPLVLVIVFYALLSGQHSGSLQNLGLTTFLQGRRNKLATWLWHLSLLLKLRIEQSTAIMIAGHSTPVGWLRNHSLKWAESTNVPVLPSNQHEFDSDQPLPPPPTLFFGKSKLRLVDYALSLSNSSFKVDLIEEIANYYWERDRITGVWWVYWLASLLNLLIFTMICLIIFGLFSIFYQAFPWLF